jgi:hypothetical protein
VYKVAIYSCSGKMAYNWLPLRNLRFWPSLFLHSAVSTFVSMIIGFLPEAFIGHLYYNTGLEAYSPMILVVAGCLGFWLNQKLGHSAACWVWILGIAWLTYGAHSESAYWFNSGYSSRMRYVMDNFFGGTVACSGSECLGELLFTTPCAASIVYSLAAAGGLKSHRKAGLGNP